MRIIPCHLEVVNSEVINVINITDNLKFWEGHVLPAQLLLHLVSVIVVDVTITSDPDEPTDTIPGDVSHHVSQQRIRCNVKWNS